MTHSEKLQFVREKCIAANPNRLLESWTVWKDGDVRDTPCRLADILLATEKEVDEITMTNGGYANILFYEYDQNDVRKRSNWNLREDDLEKQSEQTIDFFYDVLR